MPNWLINSSLKIVEGLLGQVDLISLQQSGNRKSFLNIENTFVNSYGGISRLFSNYHYIPIDSANFNSHSGFKGVSRRAIVESSLPVDARMPNATTIVCDFIFNRYYLANHIATAITHLAYALKFFERLP